MATTDHEARTTVLTLLAALACMGGLIHIGAAVDHADESVLYVLGFVAFAAAQIAWAAMVLRRPSDRLLLGGCALNAALIALWLLSRTVGLPIGPSPWVPEPVGLADLIETCSEALVAVTAWGLVAAPRLHLARKLEEHASAPIVVMLLMCALFGVGAHAG